MPISRVMLVLVVMVGVGGEERTKPNPEKILKDLNWFVEKGKENHVLNLGHEDQKISTDRRTRVGLVHGRRTKFENLGKFKQVTIGLTGRREKIRKFARKSKNSNDDTDQTSTPLQTGDILQSFKSFMEKEKLVDNNPKNYDIKDKSKDKKHFNKKMKSEEEETQLVKLLNRSSKQGEILTSSMLHSTNQTTSYLTSSTNPTTEVKSINNKTKPNPTTNMTSLGGVSIHSEDEDLNKSGPAVSPLTSNYRKRSQITDQPGDDGWYIGLVTSLTVVCMLVVVGAGFCLHHGPPCTTSDNNTPGGLSPNFTSTKLTFSGASPMEERPKSSSGATLDNIDWEDARTSSASRAEKYRSTVQPQDMKENNQPTNRCGSNLDSLIDIGDDCDEDDSDLIYECPGLASYGEMVVTNPFFMSKELMGDTKMTPCPVNNNNNMRHGSINRNILHER